MHLQAEAQLTLTNITVVICTQEIWKEYGHKESYNRVD